MNAATMSLDNAGLRKAAILVAGLDPSAADALLDRLDPAQAELVRRAVTALHEIGDDEQQRVLDEFCRIRPMMPDQCPPGIELSETPRNLAGPETSAAAADEQDDASAVPFGFLSTAEDRRLVELLRDERPQTIALVLSHLPPQRAGEALERFSPALQVEIVRRLADIENADPEAVREVERALQSRWARQTAAMDEPAVGGPDAVAAILAACDPAGRGRILANLAAEDRPLAERFGHREMAFEDLARCDDATLAAIFRAAEPEMAAAALLGAPPAIVERFLRSMPKKESRRWRSKLDHPEPIRLGDVEEARRRIVAWAENLAPAVLDKNAA